MRIMRCPTGPLIVLCCLATGISCAPKADQATGGHNMSGEAKAAAKPEEVTSCPDCMTQDVGSSEGETDHAPSLATPWVPAEQRRRIKNLNISFKNQDGSGKEVRSPSPPPLRTVRASFPAYGSSLHERPSRDAGFATTNPSL
jgi:hypothetical protein